MGAIKLAGLYRMQSYDTSKIKQYNEYAFTALKDAILHGEQTQRGAELTQVERENWNGWHPDKAQNEESSSSSGSSSSFTQGSKKQKSTEGKKEKSNSWSLSESTDTKASEQSWSVSTNDPE